ncbi:MAG: hypothetical protein ACKPEY_18990 [Planctomycetota bacterium]
MNAMALMIVAATMGVDYGWHKVADGEWEYIIQIEPGLLDTLSKGQALVSQIPPELKGIRRFRIQIGQGEVPREAVPVQGIFGADFAPRGSSPTLPYSLPPGGATNGGFSLSPGNFAFQPPPYDVYAARTSSYDWLKTNPILVDPLENLLLNVSPGYSNERPSVPTNNSAWPNASYRGNWPNSPFATRPAQTSLRQGESINRTAWGLDQPNSNPELDRFDTRTPYDERPGMDQRVTPAQITAHRPGAPLNGAPLNGSLAGQMPPPSQMANGFPGVPPTTYTNHQSGPASMLPQAFPGATAGLGSEEQQAGRIPSAQKIWWPLTTTVVLLFASLGGNFYLGWLAVDFYRRYREAAWELRTSRPNN